MKINLDIEIKDADGEMLYQILKDAGKHGRKRLIIDFTLRLK